MKKVLIATALIFALPAIIVAQDLVSQTFHENGTIATAVYQNDDEMLLVKYYEDGTVQEKGVFIDNKRNGVYQSWHQNGEKHIVATFINNEIDGTFRMWDTEGNLTVTAKYENGKVLKGNIIDSDGSVVATR